MAPKKAEKKEDAKNPDGSKPEDDKGKDKPDDDAKPDDKGEKKKLLEKIKDFFKSTLGMYVSTVFTIILFTVAIGCIIASINEWNRTADQRYAMYLVKRFMMSRDPSNEHKSDIDLLFEADNIAADLALVARLLNELDEEIVDIEYKLNHDWVAHKNALYTFNKRGRNITEAYHFCRSEKSTLIKIESVEELDFVETNVRSSFNTYWLGAYKFDNDWIWITDNTKVTTSYWAHGKPGMTEPATRRRPHCLSHTKYCGTPRGCWMDELCSEKRRVVCKMRPLKKWMD